MAFILPSTALLRPQSSSFVAPRRNRYCVPNVSARRRHPAHLQCATAATAAPISASTVTTSPVLNILSTIVGVAVLIGSVLYKIPQLVRVLRRRSAAGISISMYALETLGTTFSAVYFARRRFPFSSYGELVFVMIQNVLLMAIIVVYQDLPRKPAMIIALLYFILVAALYSSLAPMRLLMALQVCSIPILNLARVPQIYLNWRRKSTGELSPITLGLQLLGNMARIFTTIAQVRDVLMFVGIAVAMCFNGTLFFQWVFYSRAQRKMAKHLPNA